MLRTNNRGVAQAFAERRPATNSNGQFYSPDGITLYSYGDHWPIARWVDGECVFHQERYGIPTSKHTSFAFAAVPRAFIHTVPTRNDLRRMGE